MHNFTGKFTRKITRYMKPLVKFLFCLILIISFHDSRCQNIVLTEMSHPDLDKQKIGTQFPIAIVCNVLRKINPPSAVTCLSPSYKLAQADWDGLIEKFTNAFPKDYPSSALAMQRSITGEKGRVVKRTMGILNRDRTIKAYAQVFLSIDSASNSPQIIDIKLYTGNDVPSIKWTKDEFTTYKKMETSYNAYLKSQPKK
jgi:hypothetical protein